VTYPMSGGVKDVGDYELHTTLPELTPGVYEITASLLRKDKKLLARSRDLFIRYDHAKDLPWIGNKIGLEDKVAQPWTPIVTKESESNLSLACWGRTYEINGSGFPTQINTVGQNILTAPIRIEM